MKKRTASYIRNFVFGVEDSLVSTVGLISGIAVAGVSRSTIILTGVILILVEAFSMGVGSLLAENSVEEYESGKEIPFVRALRGSVVMFFSYICSGTLIILPYLAFEGRDAIRYSIMIAVLSLFVLGFLSAKFARINPWRRAVQMVAIGGLAILIGTVAGSIAEVYIS